MKRMMLAIVCCFLLASCISGPNNGQDTLESEPIEEINIDKFNDTITTDETVTVPTPKSKQEKRAANEAIVGDTRFKIDKTNRVIIY